MERLDETSTAYGMQISAEKTKLMTNNTNGISSNIRVNGEKLETVHSFKYLGAIVTDEGSMSEIRSRIAKTIVALTKFKIIWDDKNIDLSSKIRLLRSLVMSICLYSCETWTLTAEIERKIQTIGNEKFQTSPCHLAQRPHHQRRGAKQDSESRWTLRRTLVYCKKTQNEVVRACHKSFGTCRDSFSRALYGEGEGEADRENDGKITSEIGRV